MMSKMLPSNMTWCLKCNRVKTAAEPFFFENVMQFQRSFCYNSGGRYAKKIQQMF